MLHLRILPHTLIGASNLLSDKPEYFGRLTSIHALLGAAMEQINQNFYRSQLVKVNVGWRPTSEDTLPLLGSTSISNLLVATGTKRDGLHCSPVIAEYLTDLMTGGQSKYDFSLYKPERKPVRIHSRKEAVDIGVKNTINALYQHGFKPSHNRILEDLDTQYRTELESLHDRAGARDWGIPPDMISMYKYIYAK